MPRSRRSLGALSVWSVMSYPAPRMVMSRVAENARKQAKSRGPDQGFTSLDTNSAASPSDVMARLESRAVVVNPNTLTEG